jgi:hypothetical protein
MAPRGRNSVRPATSMHLCSNKGCRARAAIASPCSFYLSYRIAHILGFDNPTTADLSVAMICPGLAPGALSFGEVELRRVGGIAGRQRTTLQASWRPLGGGGSGRVDRDPVLSRQAARVVIVVSAAAPTSPAPGGRSSTASQSNLARPRVARTSSPYQAAGREPISGREETRATAPDPR